MKKLIKLLFTILILFISSITIKSATVDYGDGTEITGVIIKDKDSELVIEKEVLTLNVNEFPDVFYNDYDTFLAYEADYSIEYTLYNPTSEKVSATLLFPFGKSPSYSYDFYGDVDVNQMNEIVSRYEVLVNDEAVDKRLRATIDYPYYNFRLDEASALLNDDYIEDDFYYLDMPILKQTYILDSSNVEFDPVLMAFDVNEDIDYKVYLVGQNAYDEIDNGIRIGRYYVDDENYEYNVYFLGTDEAEVLDWNLYPGHSFKDGVSADMTLVNEEEMTFKDFVFRAYDEDLNFSEVDWYNAFIDVLYEFDEGYYFDDISYFLDEEIDINDWMMYWYEFDVELEPNERITTTFKAPLYPAINKDEEANSYTYKYILLSNIYRYDPSELEVNINTPYTLEDSSIEGFKETKYGYSLTLNEIEDNDLVIVMNETLKPEYEETSDFNVVPYVLAIALVAVIAFIYRYFKKKDK